MIKKYVSIFSATLNEELQYLAELVTKFVGYVLMVYIFVNLWQYIYSDPNEIIHGFSYNMMLWYVLIGEAFYTAMKNRSLTRGIKEDIVFGNIAYKINKPYSYPFYCVAKYFGNILPKDIATVIVGTTIGLLLIGKLDTFKPQYLLLNLLIIVLAFLVNIFWRVTLSLSAFWVEDSEPFLWVFDKLILVCGTVFPIDMYPVFVQTLIKFSPIYTIVYGPTRLLVNFEYDLFWSVLLAEVLQLIFIVTICLFVYKKGEKKVNVNGG